MDVRLLIDQIVRQTTVLIAQLSTAAGVRAPIAHIADQVFLELSQEIERQGIGRKVAADMFGMALRTYQRRVHRVTESVTTRDRTVWEAVLDYIGEESRTRQDVLHRFRYDGEANVAAVLNDLTNSGLVYRVGRGERALYGITPDADLELLIERDDHESLAALLWIQVYRAGTASVADLKRMTRADDIRVTRALETLVSDGRLEYDPDSDTYSSPRCLLPVGSEIGWEAAVYDHFQAMAKAVANKLQASGGRTKHSDRIGGATLSFDIYEGHPMADEVFGMLERFRAELNEVWDRVVQYNRDTPYDDETRIEVTFYLGQNVEMPDGEPSDTPDSADEKDP